VCGHEKESFAEFLHMQRLNRLEELITNFKIANSPGDAAEVLKRVIGFFII